MKGKKGKSITVRPDTIVEARYQLSSIQNDILDIFLTEIENNDNNDKLEYILEIKKYKHLFPSAAAGNLYRNLKNAVESFEGKGFKIISADEKQAVYFPWFSKIAYNDNKGELVVEIGRSFKETLIQMKRAIYYKPEFPISLQSMYAKRIYYMLKQYQDTGYRYDSVDTLREKLECPPSYKKYSFFKMKVLDIAREQINASTDIIIEFEEIKKGNKVVTIKFLIRAKNFVEADETITSLNLTPEEYKELEIFIKTSIEIEKSIEKSLATEYLDWTCGQLNSAQIKKNKKAYIKKVLQNDETKEKFILYWNEKEKTIRERGEKEKELLLIQEADRRKQQEEQAKLIKEYGMETVEELNEYLRQKYSFTPDMKEA